jgi:hypothetical protein
MDARDPSGDVAGIWHIVRTANRPQPRKSIAALSKALAGGQLPVAKMFALRILVRYMFVRN